MPTKSRYRAKSAKAFYVQTRINGQQITGNSTSSSYTWTDEVTGENNPQWRAQIRRGQQAGTSLTGTEQVLKSAQFFASYDYKFNATHPSPYAIANATSYGNYLLPIKAWQSAGTPSEALANNLALNNYLKKIRNTQTTFQGGVFLGELRETVHLLRHPIQSFRGGILDYFRTLKKRRKVRGPARVVKRHRKRILSETWLEYSFGWLPLLGDIDDAVKTMTQPIPDEVKNLFGVGRDKSASHSSMYVGTAPNVQILYKQTRTVTVKYYGAYAIGHSERFGARQLGFDLTNWAPTAWELIPWSFLVDYFTNIGDLVSAYTLSTQGLRWTMKTVIQESKSEVTSVSPIKPSISPSIGYVKEAGFTPGFAESTWRTIARTPYTGSLVPSIYFEVPGFGKKWLNIFALSRAARGLTPFF